MTKETPEFIAECWQMLVEYIPRKEHISAAEVFVTYLDQILDRLELDAVLDLDTDLATAYQTTVADAYQSVANKSLRYKDDYDESRDDEPDEDDIAF